MLFVEMMVWPPGLPMTQWGLPFFAIIVGVMLDRGLFPGAGRLARPKPPGFTLLLKSDRELFRTTPLPAGTR